MERARRAIVLLLLVLVAACGGGDGAAGGDGDGIRIVTTVSPITNIVANVGGDRVHVTGIVPEGTNSHTFEPRPSDAKVIAEADIIFVNGLHLEEPTMRLANANKRGDVKLIELGARTVQPSEYIYDFSFPREAGDPNPHLWTNPPYAKKFAEIVRDELILLDEAGESEYTRNYEAFAARIDALDRAVRQATATVPAQNRKLLTYHDSFPYFARQYGWRVIGAVQPSDFSEPSPREVAGLIRQIKAQKVPAIFGSEVFPSEVLEQIARESGAKYVAELRDDDLPGKKGGKTHSYLGLMVFDFKTIVSALGGDISGFDAVDTSNVVAETNATYRD